MRTLELLILGALCSACPNDSPPEPAAPIIPCHFPEDCNADQICVSAGAVPEALLEPGDQGRCVPRHEAIGTTPITWAWQPGGTALSERLCICQGMARGVSDIADGMRARQTTMLQAAGVRMIRLHIRWRNVEREPGVFNFSADDAMIDAVLSAGLKPLVVLGYGNPWASAGAPTGDDKFPPDDPADFARYVTRTVQHYAGRVQHYEIWNEPNAGYRFWKPEIAGDAQAFGALQRAAAEAVKAACPSCWLSSAGLFFHPQVIPGASEFLHDLLSADPEGLQHMDALGFHPYPLYPPLAAPEDNSVGQRALPGMAADLTAVLTHHGLAHLPLAVTELGWPVHSSTDEARQSAWLTRSVLLSAALGMDPICWYNLENGTNEGNFPPEDDFGLYRHGHSLPGAPIDPKPARDAMAWLARIGTDSRLVGPLSDPRYHNPDQGRFGLEFRGPRGHWQVLWHVEGSEPAPLPVDAPWVYDHLGQRLEPAPPNTGAAPIFMLAQAL